MTPGTTTPHSSTEPPLPAVTHNQRSYASTYSGRTDVEVVEVGVPTEVSRNLWVTTRVSGSRGRPSVTVLVAVCLQGSPYPSRLPGASGGPSCRSGGSAPPPGLGSPRQLSASPTTCAPRARPSLTLCTPEQSGGRADGRRGFGGPSRPHVGRGTCRASEPTRPAYRHDHSARGSGWDLGRVEMRSRTPTRPLSLWKPSLGLGVGLLTQGREATPLPQ